MGCPRVGCPRVGCPRVPLRALGGIVAFVRAFALALLLSCCAASPPPLRPHFDEANALAAQISARVAAHKAALAAAIEQGVAACPKEPTEAFRRCGIEAGARAEESLAPRRRQLGDWAAWHEQATQALGAARVCAEQGQPACRESERQRAEEILARLRAELERDTTP